MRPLLATVLVCASVCLCAQPASRDLWVGVLTYHGSPDGPVASHVGGEFEPVGALVDGVWHFEREDDPDHDGLRASYGRTPPQWLPVGRDLPRTWRAWLTDGRTTTFALTGPFRPAGVWDTARIAVAITLPARSWVGSEDVAGVAVAGDVHVQPFSPFSDDVEAAEKDAPSELLRHAMVNVELRELATSVREKLPGDAGRRTLSAVTPTGLADAPYSRTLSRTLTMPDGASYAVFEGAKGFGATNGCSLHSGGATVLTPGRDPVVLGAWSYLDCNETVIDHLPLAVLTRGGRSCWLFKYQYEDGSRLLLRPPGDVDYLKGESACDIR